VVKKELLEFEKLLLLEYEETGSFLALQPNVWIPSVGTCANSFTGNYAIQAQDICQKIVENSDGYGGSGNKFMAGNNKDRVNKYSIMGATASPTGFFCVGISGKTKRDITFSGLGCYANP
jgi:hypothetical protein